MRGSWMLLIALAGCTANDDVHAPQIANVAPDPAPAGSLIQVNGSYFCAQPEPEPGEEIDPLYCEHTGSVLFDSEHVSASSYTDTLIMVDVPGLAAGQVRVLVSVAGRISNGVDLTIE